MIDLARVVGDQTGEFGGRAGFSPALRETGATGADQHWQRVERAMNLLATAVLLSCNSSLAALVAAVVGAALTPFVADPLTASVIAGIALLIILRHHANIRRLISGTESPISLTKG
jgi:glycerol-3-phosphate acyltransferase PlsY